MIMNNNINPNINVNFGTSLAVSKKGWFTKTYLKHDTNFERPDLDWDFACNQIKKHAPNSRILCHACSDGSEAVTLALKLGGDYIIDAFDISKKIIKQAKKGLFFISSVGRDEDFYNKYKDFFTPKKGFLSLGFSEKLKEYEMVKEYSLDKKILKNIKFKVQDITKSFQKKQEDPCVVLFRNAWYLLKDDAERIKLSQNLYENLKPKSIVIIGHADTSHKYDGLFCHIDELLEKTGFKGIKENQSNNSAPTKIFIKD